MVAIAAQAATRRALTTVVAIALACVVAVGPASPAAAIPGYPSWGDVQAAMGDVTRNQALQASTQAQIDRLRGEAAAATAAADARGVELQRAQDAADEARADLETLRAKTAAARSRADEAQRRARGALHALVHSTRGDTAATLLTSPRDADTFLQRLGMSSKVSEISRDLYASALQSQRSVESLTARSAAAEAELGRRQGLAARALEEAQAAARTAQAATDAASAHLDELAAQLVALRQRTLDVKAKYEEGAAKAAAEAAARAAALRQAAVNSSTGWAAPVSGAVVSGFGMRVHPIYQVYKLHTGTDLVAGCGVAIFAAKSGTVTYSGPNGDLGNFIQIDHGGILTGYAHIMNGGLLVRVGQRVTAGQQIARAGSTGGSTGCHLHFIVRVDGALVDPVPFMRDRGAPLG